LFVECKENFDVTNFTSFKIGGNIEKVYFPKSVDEFIEIVSTVENVKVYGNFSNTLVSSDGYDGAIIVTSKMDNFWIEDNRFYADAGWKGPKLSKMAKTAGLSGFEFMIGFPGSLGGNVCMNASANGQCISDNITRIICWSKDKGVFTLEKNEMKFGYRYSICQELPIVILGAEFELREKDEDIIQKQMDKNLEFRKAHQPSLSLPNCGSVFRNPEGCSAGKLLEEIGAKSFVVGGAKVWENHSNFIINTGNATSEDVLNLMYKMCVGVDEKFAINLTPEVRYLGNRNIREDELCRILNIK